MPKAHLMTVVAVAALAVCPVLAFAARPDGAGPWTDSVFAFQSGTQSNGKPVAKDRSAVEAAVGVAEDDVKPAHFVSIGIGGRIALRFENPACSGAGADLRLREATTEPYPSEQVDVFVSKDGQDLLQVAKSVNKDADVSVPDTVGSFRYVVLVDVTDPRLFREADGYDLDGVQALHTTGCPEPAPDRGMSPGSGESGDAGGVGSGSTATGGSGATGSGGVRGEMLLAKAPGLKAATCRVPRLRGRSVRYARRKLRQHRCATGRITSRRSASRKGRVLKTLPVAGSRRPYRTRVRLVISRGPKR